MYKKKLIEVALPLEAINVQCTKQSDNPFLKKHPRSLHIWWARRPLSAARAIIFAQMVDDPSEHPEFFPTVEAQEEERQRLFRLIEEMVLWENTSNKELFQQLNEEIRKSWRMTCAENADHPQAAELFNPDILPAFHDPFAGGGALPLEAQRLGLEAWASDLNPVAVTINKAMVEIPPKFAGRAPVGPVPKGEKIKLQNEWPGVSGLAEDIRRYGAWVRDEAFKRIGHLYPPVEVTGEMAKDRLDLKHLVGKKLTTIAWLWARTVKSPNPAFADIDVPLVASFVLSNKKGSEAWIEPVVRQNGYHFVVRTGGYPEGAKNGTKLTRGANFRCIMSGAPIEEEYIKNEGAKGNIGTRLMAVVAETQRGRIYISPEIGQEETAAKAVPAWMPETLMSDNPRWFSPPLYGFKRYGDLFSARQLVALETLSGLIPEAIRKCYTDLEKMSNNDNTVVHNTEKGQITRAEAIGVYLALAVSKWTDLANAVVSWNQTNQNITHLFNRQAIPMTWDFAEISPFSKTASFMSIVDTSTDAFVNLCAESRGNALQLDSVSQDISCGKVVSTDPPYYDNVGYADLSDFFYVWLRKMLVNIFPDQFSTLSTPKADELVATPYRHGGSNKAEKFFMEKMSLFMTQAICKSHPAFPITIYYAFKQAESNRKNEIAQTGWETFLDAVLNAGLMISGTWPLRTERKARSVAIGTNALASSIVLVCRKRPDNAPTVTRREFLTALKKELPQALRNLQQGNIAPVDLAQAAIGPGMAVFTRYAKVLGAGDELVTVRQALALINEIMDEVLAEQEGDFDADSRWALSWFEQFGFDEGEFGVAETLSKAKNTSVSGLVEAGILASKGGKVRILKPQELPEDWDPKTDSRLTVWEMVHHLIRILDAQGETGAGVMVKKLGSHAESARALAYRLYTMCERKKRAQDALAYNALVQSWPEILRLSQQIEAEEVPAGQQFTLQ